MTGKRRRSTSLVRIAEGHSNLGRVKNKTVPWDSLIAKLSRPTKTAESFAKYLKLPKTRQDELKNTDGYWIGAHCDSGRRATRNIQERDVITFDIDDAPDWILDDIEDTVTGISDLEFVVHSTRKHTDQKPRLRIAFLLKEPIPADHYTAAARILASKLDPTMDMVDDVSFRVAQMMYYPTISRNGRFFFFHNKGKALDVEKMLDEFGDWRDYTKLPFSEKQGAQKRPSADKAEDPTEKRGPVGAFCRAYSIEEAMQEFIPETYIPGDQYSKEPRYTYAEGTSTNGAVVYGGLWLYSHHGSDPCADRLVNAFDLVRIHKFAKLDKDGKDYGSPSKTPSYKAMTDMLKDDTRTQRELAEDRYDAEAMFDDIEDYDERDDELQEKRSTDYEDLLGPEIVDDRRYEPAPKYKSWFPKKLELTEDGVIKSTLTNITVIVENDPRFWRAIAYNEFKQQIVCLKPLKSKLDTVPNIGLQDAEGGDDWEDRHDLFIRAILEAPRGRNKSGYGLQVSDRNIQGAVALIAERNRFHPVKTMLESLPEWDGKKRMDRALIEHVGAEDTPYVREVTRLIFLGCVVRVYEPGHKFDCAPILQGRQGMGKSTFIRLLAKDWFSEIHGDMGDNKKMVEQMLGTWIGELPEMAGIRRSEVRDIKAFLSTASDKVRLSYDKRARMFRRQTIFIGSTNDKQYLKDETGNRRFWPIRIDDAMKLDREKVRSMVDYYWAEALAEYRKLRKKYPIKAVPELHLDLQNPQSIAEATRYQEMARTESPDEGMGGRIAEWLETPVPVRMLRDPDADDFDDLHTDRAEPMAVRTITCLKEIWEQCMRGDVKNYTQMNAQALGRAMNFASEWEITGSKIDFEHLGRQRAYIRKDATRKEIRRGYRIVEIDDAED